MINSNHPDTIRRNANSGDGGNWGPEIEGLNEAVENLSTSIAPEFSSTSAYTAGNLAIVEGKLQKAKESISAGEYDPTKWEDTDIAANLGGGGSAIKTKDYTGNGGYTVTIEFEDTPTYILGIFQKSIVNQIPQFYGAFPFASGKTVAKNLDGGTVKGEVVTLTVEGNNLTIGGNAYFCNSNEDYTILYI